MSEMGRQKRKCWRFQVMSALPHKADINSRDRDVRFVPQADVRRVNAALAFLVRNRSRTAPSGYEDLFPPVQRSPRSLLHDRVIEWSTAISSCSSPAPETSLACADAEHHDDRR